MTATPPPFLFFLGRCTNLCPQRIWDVKSVFEMSECVWAVQAVQESLLAQIAHFVRKIIPCEAEEFKKMDVQSRWQKAKQLRLIAAAVEITREGDVLKIVGVVLTAVRKRTIGYAYIWDNKESQWIIITKITASQMIKKLALTTQYFFITLLVFKASKLV